jgi:hypothetical protein
MHQHDGFGNPKDKTDFLAWALSAYDRGNFNPAEEEYCILALPKDLNKNGTAQFTNGFGNVGQTLMIIEWLMGAKGLPEALDSVRRFKHMTRDLLDNARIENR